MEKEDIKLNFLHICDYASFGMGGKLNILGIFESINTPIIPYNHPQMFIVSNISIEKSKKASGYKNKIVKLIYEDGTEISRMEFSLNVKIPKDKERFVIGSIEQLNGIKFEKYGKYKIQIFVDEYLVGEKEITVSKIKK